MEHKLVIKDIFSDGMSGHITMHAYIEQTDGEYCVLGAVETHGIDPLALHRRFNGDVTKWLDWVGGHMKENHTRRTSVTADLHALKDKKITIPE